MAVQERSVTRERQGRDVQCLSGKSGNEPSRNITTIIFDAGGVLIYIQEYRKSVMQRVLLSRGYDSDRVDDALSRVALFDRDYFQQHSLVDWQDEKRWLQARCQFVAADVAGQDSETQVMTLADQLFMLSFDSAQYQLFDDAVSSLQRLAPHFSLNVLSNATASLDWSLDLLGIRPYFDQVVISAYERCEKPAPEIYLTTLARIGKTPQECVFIDDRIENVEAAEALGITGFHLDRQLGMTLTDIVDAMIETARISG
ncbi:HAD family hydrolase [Photobacterium japonica]|uniref:HAD family hydrolase n=1 Tax=Photobacterium japonica TaxID=2910235 RepID=UPI003D0FBACA